MPPCQELQYAETASLSGDEHDLVVRVSAEFSEMPGQRLTLAQASRLFDVAPDRCIEVLVTLIEQGVLTTDGRAFGRADLSWM